MWVRTTATSTPCRVKAGATLWSAPIGGDPSATAALGSTPAAATDVYVGSSDGTFYALRAKSGDVLWKASSGSAVTGVSGTQGLVFAESANGTFSGYRYGGGYLAWLTDVGSAFSGTPTVSDDAVIVGAGNGDLYVYTTYGLPMT
jgi:eukaryotic-like serine/threonine-protein kinase